MLSLLHRARILFTYLFIYLFTYLYLYMKDFLIYICDALSLRTAESWEDTPNLIVTNWYSRFEMLGNEINTIPTTRGAR